MQNIVHFNWGLETPYIWRETVRKGFKSFLGSVGFRQYNIFY